jgi:hypothetical protein
MLRLFDGESDTPELIWDGSMRSELRKVIAEQLEVVIEERQNKGTGNEDFTLPIGVCVNYQSLVDELFVGGVYVSRFLKEPTYNLRDPSAFLENLLQRWAHELQLYTFNESTGEEKSSNEITLAGQDALQLVTNASVYLCKVRPNLCDKLAQWGYMARCLSFLDEILSRALVGAPLLSVMRLLHVAANRRANVEALIVAGKNDRMHGIVAFTVKAIGSEDLHPDTAFMIEMLNKVYADALGDLKYAPKAKPPAVQSQGMSQQQQHYAHAMAPSPAPGEGRVPRNRVSASDDPLAMPFSPPPRAANQAPAPTAQYSNQAYGSNAGSAPTGIYPNNVYATPGTNYNDPLGTRPQPMTHPSSPYMQSPQVQYQNGQGSAPQPSYQANSPYQSGTSRSQAQSYAPRSQAASYGGPSPSQSYASRSQAVNANAIQAPQSYASPSPRAPQNSPSPMGYGQPYPQQAQQPPATFNQPLSSDASVSSLGSHASGANFSNQQPQMPSQHHQSQGVSQQYYHGLNSQYGQPSTTGQSMSNQFPTNQMSNSQYVQQPAVSQQPHRQHTPQYSQQPLQQQAQTSQYSQQAPVSQQQPAQQQVQTPQYGQQPQQPPQQQVQPIPYSLQAPVAQQQPTFSQPTHQQGGGMPIQSTNNMQQHQHQAPDNTMAQQNVQSNLMSNDNAPQAQQYNHMGAPSPGVMGNSQSQFSQPTHQQGGGMHIQSTNTMQQQQHQAPDNTTAQQNVQSNVMSNDNAPQAQYNHMGAPSPGVMGNSQAQAPVQPAPVTAGTGIDARTNADPKVEAEKRVDTEQGAPGAADGRVALLQSALQCKLPHFLVDDVLENSSLSKVKDPAAAKVHSVELLKLLADDPAFGMKFQMILDGIPAWKKYKAQNHSLFITGPEQKADYFLTDGSSGEPKKLLTEG